MRCPRCDNADMAETAFVDLCPECDEEAMLPAAIHRRLASNAPAADRSPMFSFRDIPGRIAGMPAAYTPTGEQGFIDYESPPQGYFQDYDKWQPLSVSLDIVPPCRPIGAETRHRLSDAENDALRLALYTSALREAKLERAKLDADNETAREKRRRDEDASRGWTELARMLAEQDAREAQMMEDREALAAEPETECPGCSRPYCWRCLQRRTDDATA